MAAEIVTNGVVLPLLMGAGHYKVIARRRITYVLSVVASMARYVFYLGPSGSFSTSVLASMARYVFTKDPQVHWHFHCNLNGSQCVSVTLALQPCTRPLALLSGVLRTLSG